MDLWRSKTRVKTKLRADGSMKAGAKPAVRSLHIAASSWHHRSMTAVMIDVLREHAVDNNEWWKMQEGMHKMASQTNKRPWEVCSVVEQKMMQNEADKDVMDRTAKFANSVKVRKAWRSQRLLGLDLSCGKNTSG